MPESTKPPQDNYQVDFAFLVHGPLGAKRNSLLPPF